jgi:hypothetical protein
VPEVPRPKDESWPVAAAGGERRSMLAIISISGLLFGFTAFDDAEIRLAIDGLASVLP